MIRISLNGNMAKIEGQIPKDVLKEIDKNLSFFVQGSEYTNAYKDGDWDGVRRLFRYGQFPIGFTDKVKYILGELQYEVIDNRVEGEEREIEWLGPELRDYQKTAVNMAKAKSNAFIVLPTGSGKTEIAMKLIQEIGRSAIIVVHTKELLQQWKRRIVNNLNINPGIIGGGRHTESFITIATIQTLVRKPAINQYDILVVDEGHHIAAETYYKIAQLIKSKWRYCLSATPYREDGKELLLLAHSGDIIEPVSVNQLIDEGYLARPVIYNVPGARIGWDYTSWQEAIEALFEDETRNMQITTEAIRYFVAEHKIYIDVRYVEHGKKINELINSFGIPSLFIHGGDSSEKREDVLSRFAIEDFVLVSTLIKEGVDLPEMNVIILAGSGKSTTQTIQTIGRSLRPKEDMNEATIIDFIDKGLYVGKWFEKRQEIIEKYYGEINGNVH